MNYATMILLAALWPCAWARAAATPVIEKLGGDQAVIVTVRGEQRRAAEGMELEAWSRVRTGPRASASIRYPDGSLVTVARNTEYETRPASGEAQWNHLEFGAVRGVIQKDPKAAASGTQGKPPIKFIIRTRNATMGVRGTDFVLEADEATGKSQVHTLEGEVDLAPNDAALRTDQGVPVTPGNAARADFGGVSEPVKFQPEQYLQELKAEKPELLAVAIETNEPKPASQESAARTETAASAGRPVKSLFEDLAAFQLSGMFLVQGNGGGQLFTMEASWNPSLEFSELLHGALGLRGHAGFFELKNEGQNSQFLATRLGGFVTLRPFGHWLLEGGMLYETWGSGNAQGALGPAANLSYELGYGKLLERVYVGASQYPSAGFRSVVTEQFNAGLGFQL